MTKTNADRSEEAACFAAIIADLTPEERQKLLRMWKENKTNIKSRQSSAIVCNIQESVDGKKLKQ